MRGVGMFLIKQYFIEIFLIIRHDTLYKRDFILNIFSSHLNVSVTEN
jgi:hypothetical protein